MLLGWGIVEHLPSMFEALESIHGTTETKKKITVQGQWTLTKVGFAQRDS